MAWRASLLVLENGGGAMHARLRTKRRSELSVLTSEQLTPKKSVGFLLPRSGAKLWRQPHDLHGTGGDDVPGTSMRFWWAQRPARGRRGRLCLGK